jgi:hypothetical protein
MQILAISGSLHAASTNTELSMGGLESLHANLRDPKAVSASVIIYGFGFDKIDTKQLEVGNR